MLIKVSFQVHVKTKKLDRRETRKYCVKETVLKNSTEIKRTLLVTSIV